MQFIEVKLSSKEKIAIDKQVFLNLLDLSHIKQYKSYQNTILRGEITFSELKNLAAKSGIPYPIFFAPINVVELQIDDKNKHINEKIPSKEDFSLQTRGMVKIEDIELLIRDLSRKQEFLKRRILKRNEKNTFVGSLLENVKKQDSTEIIAEQIRTYFGIDLEFLRTLSKENVLGYLVRIIEEKDILVSFSSYNYMPQNIPSELELSGFCINDKRFPFVFINTNDGVEKQKIIETSGRQIFTLLSMIACIGMKQFLLSSNAGSSKNDYRKLAYRVAGEIIVPRGHLHSININTIEELKVTANSFKVTPSMLLYRLNELTLIDSKLTQSFKEILNNELSKFSSSNKRAPLPVNAYSKYNGIRFSKEIVRAYITGTITQLDAKNILFRKNKMDRNILEGYIKKHK